MEWVEETSQVDLICSLWPWSKEYPADFISSPCLGLRWSDRSTLVFAGAGPPRPPRSRWSFEGTEGLSTSVKLESGAADGGAERGRQELGYVGVTS